MSRFLMEWDDYNLLVDLAQSMMSSNTDITVRNILDSITSKYSIKGQINEIKRILYADVTKYPKGTSENKAAYEIYQSFKEYIKDQSEEIENGNLTFDELNFELEKIKVKF